jgi:DNA-directed RNA polymerase specialized sigma24 family protein
VYRYIYSKVGQAEEAEDLTSEDDVNPANNGEAVDWLVSAAQVRAATADLGERPLVVLTAGDPAAWPGLPPDLTVARQALQVELQGALAHLSTRGRHVVVERSGSFIQFDQPQAVVEAVRAVVEAVQRVLGS